MLYTCDKCGKTRTDQIIDGAGSLAICPECGYARPFRRMPLFAVGGACGTGKTALCKKIAGKVEGPVALDGDGLWEGKGYDAGDPGKFYEDALRIAMNISQSGPAVAVFHAGFGLPGNLEKTVSRWENGVNYPDVSALPGLCQTLEVSADQLLGLGESPKGRKLIRTVEVFELEDREEAQKLMEEFRSEAFPRLISARIDDTGGRITLTAEKEFGVELSKLRFEG